MQYQWWKNVLNFLSIADAIYTQHLLLCHRHGDTTIVPIPSLSLCTNDALLLHHIQLLLENGFLLLPLHVMMMAI